MIPQSAESRNLHHRRSTTAGAASRRHCGYKNTALQTDQAMKTTGIEINFKPRLPHRASSTVHSLSLPLPRIRFREK
jgi:hypothetical protein